MSGKKADIVPQGRPITIELPARTEYLVLVRHFVCSMARYMGFEADDVNQIEIALDEACANSIRAIQQQAPARGDALLRLEFHRSSDCLDITVIDNGNSFSEHFDRQVPMDELVGRFQTSGYGLQIIKTFMDHVDYQHLPNEGNRLRLKKNLTTTTT